MIVFPSMATQETVVVTIQDVAFGGSGVARLPDGKVVFVPYTLTGEEVRIRLQKQKKGFSEGILMEVLKPSPHRVQAPCVYFGTCGGCQYQHAAYDEQLRIKAKQARDTLERIGGLTQLPEIQAEKSPSEYGYRNKITLHTNLDGDIGFFANDQRTVIDIEKCIISTEEINEKLTNLRKSSHRPRHITLVDSKLRVDSPDGIFHQVNSAMAEQMLGWVRGITQKQPAQHLIDLYCGTGFFALGLAQDFKTVWGVDQNSKAIHHATIEGNKSHPGKTRFYSALVEEKVKWMFENIPQGESTTLLVDPPREGLHPQIIPVVKARAPEHLIYISCNPATLARDLKQLLQGDVHYEAKAIRLFDMFPQTAHIEVGIHLTRSNA
jgi:tRNA/tmRNA/rRNA uracil-C5-methylase (TrmA/RlmC/RlmD family)